MGTNVQVDSASAKCTQTMSGALMLIESLKEKVEMIFGYPGGAVLPIYDKLYNSGMVHILPVTNKVRFMRRKDTQEYLENLVSSLPRQVRGDKPRYRPCGCHD